MLLPSPFQGAQLDDDPTLRIAAPGDYELRIISPTMLEAFFVSTRSPDPAPQKDGAVPTESIEIPTALPGNFQVTVDSQPAVVTQVGFKRRVAYAPVSRRDLRIGNAFYLQLARPIDTKGGAPEVRVTDLTDKHLLPVETLMAKADPLRYSPAIHVNQEGYAPSFSKKAMIGYYLGSLGELDVPADAGFSLVEAASGQIVFRGLLTLRSDLGYAYAPLPYQKVLEADFSNFRKPGTYRLAVAGLGTSWPFLIDEGIAIGFARTYALGLYHQRCGTANALPYTRFVHDACHTAPASVPVPQANYAFTWTTVAQMSAAGPSSSVSAAPQLKDEASQLYPFVNRGKVDVSGGHHDAGDYSKYTVNSAELIHWLIFAVDNLPGVAGLDNLGIPESGDGISDVLQEAKWESDFLAKMQDADGGFYFLVYPENREYESNVLPEHGDPQVVWPKNTAATAAAVAALAQCASSPRFKKQYPAAAELYLKKARLGWKFLTEAIAKHGREGAYQKVTFYGDNWGHDDELAWAACELFLATGDPECERRLFADFPNPGDPATLRWGWQRLSESWGNAIRSYAFAARSGRLPLKRLEPHYLSACEAQIVAAGDDALAWSRQNAYASSFPESTKRAFGGGWYFALNQASDMAVAYQLAPKVEYVDALVGNMNYEAGCNPVNVCYLTGLGWKRPHEIVDQYAQNDGRKMPPPGIPVGSVQAAFEYLPQYQLELVRLSYPDDNAPYGRYSYYDRWSDAYNVTTEYISVNLGRSLAAAAFLAHQSAAAARPWKSAMAQIEAPKGVAVINAPITLRLQAKGLDLTRARIVWEARDQDPAFGPDYVVRPRTNGQQWAEAEAEWPDGRRVFASTKFMADGPVVIWVNGSVPAGASTAAGGKDAWNWVDGIPDPLLSSFPGGPVPVPGGPAQHASALADGLHEHWFEKAASTLAVGPTDILFAQVYLDPAHPPEEVMLVWNDGSSWEHRAYWGDNKITYGKDGTAGRRPMGPLPAPGGWVRLEVPASLVGLAGRMVSGMGFSLFDGGATWDVAGKRSGKP